MLIDLHVVSSPDCPVTAIAARLGEIGFDGAVVAGTNSIPVLDTSSHIFAGADVETDRGRYLVLFPDPATTPLADVFGELPKPWPVRDVVARTQALNGAVVALAPYDATAPHPGGDILYTLPALSAVQTVAPAHPAGIAHPAIEAADVMGLPCVGGSDATTLDEIGRAGTLFSHEVKSHAELIAALRAGACWPVDFAGPPADLLHRGRAPAPRENAPPHAVGHEHRRRRRR